MAGEGLAGWCGRRREGGRMWVWYFFLFFRFVVRQFYSRILLYEIEKVISLVTSYNKDKKVDNFFFFKLLRNFLCYYFNY